jgi:hypothetical protein
MKLAGIRNVFKWMIDKSPRLHSKIKSARQLMD